MKDDGGDDELWRFALDLYGMSGAADSFLLLQDSCSVDVSFLIFVLFLQRAGLAVDRALLETMDGIVAEWRSDVVVPLRQTRRALKILQQRDGDASVEALRQAIKTAELQAERHQLRMLKTWFDRDGRSVPATDAGGIKALVSAVATLRDPIGGNAEAEGVRGAIATIAESYRRMPAIPRQSSSRGPIDG